MTPSHRGRKTADMTRYFLLPLVILAACKGETKTVDNPQTIDDLKKCDEAKKQKDDLIATLTAEKAQWERDKGQGSGGEVTVVIEGNILTVKGNVGAGGNQIIDPKLATAASQEFIDVVAKSRGAIQKCYEGALKKDSSIQARTITLTVRASFTPVGVYQASTFEPSLGSVFDTCMKTIESKWALTQKSPSMNFKAQVSLTPS